MVYQIKYGQHYICVNAACLGAVILYNGIGLNQATKYIWIKSNFRNFCEFLGLPKLRQNVQESFKLAGMDLKIFLAILLYVELPIWFLLYNSYHLRITLTTWEKTVQFFTIDLNINNKHRI